MRMRHSLKIEESMSLTRVFFFEIEESIILFSCLFVQSTKGYSFCYIFIVYRRQTVQIFSEKYQPLQNEKVKIIRLSKCSHFWTNLSFLANTITIKVNKLRKIFLFIGKKTENQQIFLRNRLFQIPETLK